MLLIEKTSIAETMLVFLLYLYICFGMDIPILQQLAV